MILFCFPLDLDKDSCPPNTNNYEKQFIELGQKANRMPLSCSVLFLLLKTLPHSLGGKLTLRVSQTCYKSLRITGKSLSLS